MRQPMDYYGSATVGERGQIVIPAQARKSMGLQAGDKVVVLGRDGGQRLTILKAERAAEFISRAIAELTAMDEALREAPPAPVAPATASSRRSTVAP